MDRLDLQRAGNASQIQMPRLSREQRLRAIGMLEAGATRGEVARHFHVIARTIARLQTRYAETGSVADRQRSGRIRVTTRRQDRAIRLQHLRDRFLPAAHTAALTVGTHGRPVSDRTIRRRLQQEGLRARRPFRGPILTEANRQNRLQWAQRHQRWTLRQWENVLFSDESRFCVSVADGRLRVWRRRGERYARCCITEHNRFGGPSVMVWGGISGDGRTELVVINGNLNADRYINEVLTPHVIPYMNDHPHISFFQQDNARPHAARRTVEFLDENDVDVLQWPPYSPDMSPIEHVWDILGRRVNRRNPLDRESLIRFLQEEWDALDQAEIHNLIRSMRRRCTACIDARGGHTPY